MDHDTAAGAILRPHVMDSKNHRVHGTLELFGVLVMTGLVKSDAGRASTSRGGSIVVVEERDATTTTCGDEDVVHAAMDLDGSAEQCHEVRTGTDVGRDMREEGRHRRARGRVDDLRRGGRLEVTAHYGRAQSQQQLDCG